MSPEQLAGKKVDGRSDLYSLGVMLFQMLAGVLPFRGDSMSELMYKIANEEAPDIRIIRPDFPQALADIVALALSTRPETRYQTGDQFAMDLRRVMGQISDAAPAQRSTQSSPKTAFTSSDQTVAFAATVPAMPTGVQNRVDFTATVPATLADSEQATQQIKRTQGSGSSGGRDQEK
jgi:serine/threonine-protein kinase